MKYRHWCNTLLLLALMSSAAHGAQLSLNLVDAKGAALNDAVVALLPATPIDYNGLPSAIMDQRKNMFVPGVLAIRVNTQVRFPNSDDVRHHVYSFSPAKKFELRLYHGMTAEPVVFDKPGTVVLGCNIHDSMVAYIYVVETEYFALSDAQGRVTINAPAGNYELQVQHPRMTDEYPRSPVQLSEQRATSKNILVNNLGAVVSNEPDDELSTLF